MESYTHIKHTSELTGADQASIDQLNQQAFPEHAGDYVWAPVDWFVLVYAAGVLASKVEIVDRIGTVAGQPVHLGGIGGVGTLPALRRRGLSSIALRAAADFMGTKLEVAFGLLICEAQTIPLYQVLGWQVIPAPLSFDQPGRGKVLFDEITMVLPCAGQAWPAGPVDLCGLPW